MTCDKAIASDHSLELQRLEEKGFSWIASNVFQVLNQVGVGLGTCKDDESLVTT